MSSHCSKYPGCGCGPDIGTKCYSDDQHTNPTAWVGDEYRELTDKEMYEIGRHRKSLKTNGKSEYVYIDHPDTVPHTGSTKKIRLRSGTNFTPPKKKRKK